MLNSIIIYLSKNKKKKNTNAEKVDQKRMFDPRKLLENKSGGPTTIIVTYFHIVSKLFVESLKYSVIILIKRKSQR